MRHWLFGWWPVVVIWSLPYLLLVIAGSLWLWEHGWLVPWMLAAAGAAAAVWPLAWWLRRRNLVRAVRQEEVSTRWSPQANDAWGKVEQIAARVESQGLAIHEPQDLWPLLVEVVETVAAHFRPDQRDPVLEIPVPAALRIIERVAGDLARETAEHLPGAHILTIGDLRRLTRLARWNRGLYLVYKIVTAGFNPLAALARELRDSAGDVVWEATAESVKRQVLGLAVRRTGRYAIELYSGQIVVDPEALAAYRTRRSKKDLAAAASADAQRPEPFRLLVAGQVKAGKSSLVNALFGQVRAAVDVLPCTMGVQPYLLERNGIERAIILDTSGFAGLDTADTPFDLLGKALAQCDLTLLVCSATSAARDADRQLLRSLAEFFQQRPQRAAPPLLVVLTHIDLLRPFQEWDPPYDLLAAASPKARQIAAAVRIVAGELGLLPQQVIPVCLKPGRIYNVEEVLIPAMIDLLPEVDRARYLRCLGEYRSEEYWRQLWRQAGNAGRFLWRQIQAAAR